jgi:hypothetical protein
VEGGDVGVSYDGEVEACRGVRGKQDIVREYKFSISALAVLMLWFVSR